MTPWPLPIALLLAVASPAVAQHGGHAGHGAPPSSSTGQAAPDTPAQLPSKENESAVGTAAAPPVPLDRWADRSFPKAEMDAARSLAREEHGGGRFSQVTVNLAEVQLNKGSNGYRWDAEAWFGGDIDRLTLKSEGEGTTGKQPESAEVQALWSHALDAYWNVQAGARVDLGQWSDRAYATIGVEGLAPFWFEVEGAAFLSDRGELHGRIGAHYDQRITQRLILQPRVELNLAAQDVPASHVGAGLVDTELGLRLRYEIVREFAPYIGVSWERQWGATARIARAHGEDVSKTSFVAGVRFWF